MLLIIVTLEIAPLALRHSLNAPTSFVLPERMISVLVTSFGMMFFSPAIRDASSAVGATICGGAFKLCLSAAGQISSVTMIKSTGFPAYDNKILQTMRGEWKYKPFAINGKAVPVCTSVTFIYSQQ